MECVCSSLSKCNILSISIFDSAKCFCICSSRECKCCCESELIVRSCCCTICINNLFRHIQRAKLIINRIWICRICTCTSFLYISVSKVESISIGISNIYFTSCCLTCIIFHFIYNDIRNFCTSCTICNIYIHCILSL